MIYFIVKTLITALIVAITSELSRRYPSLAGIILVMPLTCILTFIWIYNEAGDAQKIVQASYDILYLAIPSLLFFVMLPILLKNGINFYISLVVSFIVMLIGIKVFYYFKN
jgi:hypothetical protein